MNLIRSLIEALPRLTAGTPAQTSVGTTEGQVLAANDNRKGLMIVNTGATVIYLTLGSAAPTATVYHVPLRACSSGDDGTGGSYVDDNWIGAVRAISSAPGGTLVITEIT